MELNRLGPCMLIRCGHAASGDEMLYLVPVSGVTKRTPEQLDKIGDQLHKDLLRRGFNDSRYEARSFVRDPSFKCLAVTVLEGVESIEEQTKVIEMEVKQLKGIE